MEHARHGRRVLVDDQVDGLDPALGVWGMQCLHRHRHHGRVLGPLGRFDRDHPLPSLSSRPANSASRIAAMSLLAGRTDRGCRRHGSEQPRHRPP